jgi:adenylate cyclase class 2
MQNIEYEAKFININKNDVREKLKLLGAQLIKPEFLQKRIALNLPKGYEIKGAWVRVRDEQDKITMSLKIVDRESISDQKEICLKVDNFEEAEKLLVLLGCTKKSYHENKRELWKFNDVEVMIDEWPFVDPFVEIEADSEIKVKEISEKLGFDYSSAIFGATDIICQKKYNISLDVINKVPEIRFDMENPYLNVDKNNKNG